MKIISIDPGLEKVAFAVWDEAGTLTHASLVIYKHGPGKERAEKWRTIAEVTAIHSGMSMGENLLIAEIPQVYRDKKSDPNDLIDLAGVVGALAGKLSGTVEWSPVPREWKGQIPKTVTQTRVKKRLSQAERDRVDWPIPSLCHNVYDAIHLGLVYLEREGIRSLPKES